MNLTKVTETSSTITLGWTPPVNADVYVFYANGQMVSFAGKNNKDGTPRNQIKYSKTTPGPPFMVVAVCHSPNGAFTLDVGAYPSAPPDPPPSGTVTGTHWAEPPDYAKLKTIGYGFAVTNVAPADQAGAKAKLDAAKAAGIKLVIGMYAFGGPEPYVYNAGSDTFTLTAAATSMLNYLKSRESEIVAFFGFNEPYWVGADGHTDPCGVYSAASLRDLRNKIKAVWPERKDLPRHRLAQRVGARRRPVQRALVHRQQVRRPDRGRRLCRGVGLPVRERRLQETAVLSTGSTKKPRSF